MNFKAEIVSFSNGVLNSYSQIFFARSKSFAIFLLVVTFFDPVMGFCGLSSIVISNIFALTLGLVRKQLNQVTMDLTAF